MTLIRKSPRLTALFAYALLLLTGVLFGTRAQSDSVANLPLQKGHTQAVLEGGWSPDDRLLLTYSAADGYLSVWEMPEGRLRWRVEAATFVKEKRDEHYAPRAFAWSDDGRLIATGSENGTAQVWDAATGKMLWKSRVATEYVAGVAFSHDGKFVAATAAPEDEDMRLALLDVAEGAKAREFQGMGGARFLTYYHDDRPLFNSDDGRLTIGDRRGVVTKWDVASGALMGKRELNPCGAEARNPGSFVYSRDLNFVAARCGKKTVLTHTATGEVLRSQETGYESNALAFSPDGRQLATSDISGEMYVWDARSGRLVRELDGGDSSDDAIAFSPDGKRLASGGGNQNIIMCDAQTGRRLWHVLPVAERYRPTPEEAAEQKLEAERAATEANRIEQEVTSLSPKVFVTFEHYGEPIDPRETRIFETGKPDKSLRKQNREEATGVWLRLHNDSPLPVSISTESSYLPGEGRCGYQTPRRFYYGLCEGAEIGIRVGVRDAKGKPLPYGFDFGGISMVPPKTSVLFSLPRPLLKDGKTIIVRYRFMKENERGKLEDYGESRDIRFTEASLKL